MAVYEYVITDKVKTWLKIEDLHLRLKHFSGQPHRIDHHRALLSLLELTDIIQKHDIRQDFSHELEKLKAHWTRFINNPDISTTALASYLEEITRLQHAMSAASGRFGGHLQDLEWLMQLKNKWLVPGGSTESEQPVLRWWLDQGEAKRAADLALWTAPIEVVLASNELLLRFLRQTVSKERVNASNGQYSRMISTPYELMLVRIVLPSNEIIPEFIANKIKLNINFAQMVNNKKVLFNAAVPFELHFCTLIPT